MRRIKKYTRSFVWQLVRFVLWFFGIRFETGTLTLLINGQSSITITTGFQPKDVWISAGDPVGIPVCQGDIDCFDVRIMPDGFILLVNMSSTYRELHWVALR